MGWQAVYAAFAQIGTTIINSAGVFVYSGPPGFGNLLVSIAEAAGTDTFGNPVPEGLGVNMGVIAGTTITGSIFQGTDFILDQNGLWFYSGTPGGPGTWLSVGGFIQSQAATIATSPAQIGDFLVLHVSSEGGAPPVSVSGGKYNWQQIGSTFTGTINSGFSSAVFVGTATATGAATATVTYSGVPSAFRNAGQGWRSSTGGFTIVDQEVLDSAGTNTMPAILPTAAGQLYSCFEFDNSIATAGATSGYTYDVDANGNGFCFNGNCTAASQAPVWGSSTCAFGTAVMLTAATGARSNLVMALVNPSGTGIDQFGNHAPFGYSSKQPVYLGPLGASPLAVANEAVLFSAKGEFQYTDGRDKQSYRIGQLRSSSAGVAIGGTSATAIRSFSVGGSIANPVIYDLHIQIMYQGNQAAGAPIIGFHPNALPAGFGYANFVNTLNANYNNSAPVDRTGPTLGLNVAQLFEMWFTFTSTTSTTYTITGSCSIGADTWNMLYCKIDLRPVG
jgi:hypothetical protein